MNARQAAVYLGMALRTVRKLASEGRIPARKVGTGHWGGEWSFSAEALDAYRPKKRRERSNPLRSAAKQKPGRPKKCLHTET